MTTATPAVDDVLAEVEGLGPPGTPVTTPEVAAAFDCSTRTVYNRLDALVADGALETKKVGANSRVWWRPATPDPGGGDGAPGREQIRAHPVFDSELVGVIVWGPELTIRDANEAFLEMADLEYEDALGTSWRDLTPEEFHPASERHVEQVEATGSGVPYEKQYYRADGSRFWGLFESRRVDGVGYVEFVVDVTDRKEAERELRGSEERLDAFVRATAEVVYRMSPDWSEMYYLDGQEFVTDTREPRGSWVEEYIPEDERPRVMAAIEDAIETTSMFEMEHQVVTVDGSRGWVHARAVPILDDDGEITEWFGTSTDITRRKEATRQLREGEAALERLNATTRELLETESGTIPDRVAPLVREVLDVEYAALWQYDGQRGDIEEYAVATAPDGDLGTVELSAELSDPVWETFVGTDVDVATVPGADTDAWGPLESCVLVPLGRHGVVCLASTRADTFDERTVDLVETVGATVETAWDRAENERELAERNEDLTRLDRLNTLIRQIDQALVHADTREGIEAAVCDRLADSDLYEFAWIGAHEPGTETVEPRAWAGVDSGYLEPLSISVDGESANPDPIACAIRTGELQVVADIATDRGFASWREATLERGARSLVCIPLVYEDRVYGVLTVYAGRPQSDEDERNWEVLSELGATIAHALNARETRATLRTDRVVELTLRFADADTPLCRLSRETGCAIDYQGSVTHGGGIADVFFVVSGASSASFRECAESLLAVEELDCLAERGDDSLCRARVTEQTLASRITDEDAVVRALTIDAGVATAVVDVAHTASVREFLDELSRWAEPDLRARQSLERPLKTQQTFVSALDDRLTARQREVLQTAYLSGFFETPRVSTGQEVTRLLGVSQPTFSEHLRAAQRALCEVLFETDSLAISGT